MQENPPSNPNYGGGLLSILEKLAEVRVLVLVLCLIFYLDIWLIRNNVNPVQITFDDLGVELALLPIYDVAIFFLSFSLLVGAVFPALRKLISFICLFVAHSISIKTNRTIERQRHSDWSLALVALSLYDLGAGVWSASSYQGLALYLVDLNNGDNLEIVILKIVSLLFWSACLALAFEIDDIFDEANF